MSGQPPLAPLPVEAPLVELCSVTLLTPSIRRRRSSICGDFALELAQPESVNVGTLPGGVAEATDEAAPAEAAEELAAAAGLATAVASSVPTVPVSDEIEMPLGQHAAEFVEGVRPVEAGVDQRRRGLLCALRAWR